MAATITFMINRPGAGVVVALALRPNSSRIHPSLQGSHNPGAHLDRDFAGTSLVPSSRIPETLWVSV